ncbi:MAG: hypothetical protein ACOZQL_27010 [Myxococcota bacterium]
MALREVYIVAVEEAEPITQDAVRELFGAEEVELVFGEDDSLFSVRADASRVDVKFEPRFTPLGWTPELLTGPAELREALQKAHGFYRVYFEPGKPQASIAAFEALWTVRTLMELTGGVAVDVTSFKLHSAMDVEEITELDFDIRDHITVHAETFGDGERATWVHTHGMAKFAAPDVEMFHISEDDLAAAETFFQELCTDLAFGQGPQLRQVISTSVGMGFQLLPAGEARANLFQVDPETFTGHTQGFISVVSPEGRHGMSDILQHYRDRFEEESSEEAEAKATVATRLLPLFKGRYMRKGLMEPLTFLVRAPFEVHPEGDDGAADQEQLWVEVVQWDESSLIGRLVEGGTRTTEWRKGSHVEVDDSQINALAVAREGRQLEPEEMERLLQLERPA